MKKLLVITLMSITCGVSAQKKEVKTLNEVFAKEGNYSILHINEVFDNLVSIYHNIEDFDPKTMGKLSEVYKNEYTQCYIKNNEVKNRTLYLCQGSEFGFFLIEGKHHIYRIEVIGLNWSHPQKTHRFKIKNKRFKLKPDHLLLINIGNKTRSILPNRLHD